MEQFDTDAHMTDDMARRYIELKAQGLSTTEAARRAGYSTGAPSPRARRLWEKAELDDGTFDLAGLQARADKLRAELKELQEEIREAQDWVDAVSYKRGE